MQKILSFIIALLLLLIVFVSCSEPNNNQSDTTVLSAETNGPASDTTSSNHDANGYLLDELPELNFDNETVTMLMWNDFTMTEFYDGSSAPDFVGEAINFRNVKVQDRLGLKLNFIETPGSSSHMNAYIKKVEIDAQASPSEYDIYAGYSRTAPALATRGLVADLLSTEYFNTEMPWWPDTLMNECTLNGKLFFCSGDISTNMLWMMTATFFNKRLIEEVQIDKDPYKLVADNEWTIDKMIEMTRDIYTDDGNGIRDSFDKYGYVIYDVNVDAFQSAANITSIVKTDSGELAIADDFHNDKIVTLAEKVGDFILSPGVLHSSSISIRSVFFDERAMMISDRVFIVAGKDNASNKDKINFEFGIVPMPKYSPDQLSYVTNMGHPFTMYAINKSSKYVEESSALLEAMGSENYRSITPKVFEAAMKVRYASDTDAGRMYDIIRAGVSFDLGRLYSSTFGDFTSSLFNKTVMNGGIGYAASYKTAEKAIKNGIKTLTNSFEE